MFVYRLTEATEYVKIAADFLRNIQTSRVNNSRILRIKNVKFSVYCFYMDPNIW